MAQYNIGTMYENGEGVARDEAVAAQWYRKAAAQGYVLALNKIAEKGEAGGVPVTEAAQAAAESGR